MTYIHIIRINVIFISLQYYPRGIICTHTYTQKKRGNQIRNYETCFPFNKEKKEELQTDK